MSAESGDDRISHLSTWWTLMRQAGSAGPSTVHNAQRQLVERYSGAVYRYLLGAVRNEEAARELFQEFALRFLRGDYRRASADRGRFRDYLKAVLSHLVTDYFRTQARRPAPLPENIADREPRDDDTAFVACWREEILNRTWQALEAANADHHAVLLAMSREPDLSAAELAERASVLLGRPISPGNARVLLHRARESFARLLLDDLRVSLEPCDDDALRRELRDLGLLGLCEHRLDSAPVAQ